MVELNIPDVPADTPESATAPAESSTPAPDTATPQGSDKGATESSTPSPSSTSQPPAEQMFEIKVDGKVEKVTMAEAIALAQQGKSYTQKSQQLAEEKRRWESEKSAEIERERQRAVQELREQEERRQAESEKDPAQRAIERVTALEQQIEDNHLDSVLKSLAAKHDGFDERQFLIEAQGRGLRTAKDVAEKGEEIARSLVESQNRRFEARFKDMLAKGDHPELKALKQKWLAEYLKDKGSGPTPPSGVTPALGEAPKRKAKNFDEAADMAEEMMRGGVSA